MLEKLNIRDCYDGFLFLAESVRNPPVLKSHRHRELELNLVVQGSITYVVSGNRYTFPQGTLLWMYPSQEHQLVDRTSNAQYYVAVFKPELIANACHGESYDDLKKVDFDREGVLSRQLKPEAYDLMRRNMDALMEDSLDPDLLNREAGFGLSDNFSFEHGAPDALNAGLRYLLILGWRCYRTGQSSARAVQLHPGVEKALYLLSQRKDTLSLKELASRCGISDVYLSRLFHQQVGVPLSRYRNSARLQRFMELYRGRSQPTMLEAAFEAGFGSYAQFFKIFSEAYGQSPRTYLQMKPKDAELVESG